MEAQQPLFTREETEAHESHPSRLLGKRVVDDSKPTLLSSIMLITDPCLGGWRRIQRGIKKSAVGYSRARKAHTEDRASTEPE